eukprot:Pgem_evm1s16781
MNLCILLLFVISWLSVDSSIGCTNVLFSQCGGTNHSGEVCCQAGQTCSQVNNTFSSCIVVDSCSNQKLSQC